MYVCELQTRKEPARPPRVIRGPDDVERLLAPRLRKAKQEHFLVVLLTTRQEPFRVETISVGSLDASIVHPREVFRPAILRSAKSLILVHNHPSGDPEPSEDDLAITKRLSRAGDLLGISVLDHVILAGRGLVSLRARGLLSEPQPSD